MYPKNTLIRELPECVDVLCTHPMFGPQSGKAPPILLTHYRMKTVHACDKAISHFLVVFYPMPYDAPLGSTGKHRQVSWVGLPFVFERVRIRDRRALADKVGLAGDPESGDVRSNAAGY